jgi:hypothetical protein
MNVVQWTGVGILVVVGLVFCAEFLTRMFPSRNHPSREDRPEGN